MKIRKILISVLFAVIIVFACGNVQANEILKNRPKFSLKIKSNYLYMDIIQLISESKGSFKEKKYTIKFYIGNNMPDMTYNITDNYDKKSNNLEKKDIRTVKFSDLYKDKKIKIVVQSTIKFQTEDEGQKSEEKENTNKGTKVKTETATRTEYLYLKDPDLNINFSKSNVIEATSKNRLKNLIINVKDNKDTLIKTITLTPTELLDGKTKYTIKGQDQTKTEELDDNKYNKLFINQDYWNKMKINYGTKLTITATDVYGFKTTKNLNYIYPNISDINMTESNLTFKVSEGEIGKIKGNEIYSVDLYRAKSEEDFLTVISDKREHIPFKVQQSGSTYTYNATGKEIKKGEDNFFISVRDIYGIIAKYTYDPKGKSSSKSRRRSIWIWW